MKLRLILLFVTALTSLPLAYAADQNIQARFEKSLKDAKAISNVEIKWVDTLWIGDPAGLKVLDPDAKEFSRTFEYSFTAAGPKFRATCKLVSGTETNLVKLTEAAFDGKTYVTYTADFGQMSKRSKTWPAGNAEAELNPLTAPFMFLSKHGDDCLQCVLRSIDLASNDFAQGFVLPAAQSTNGLLEISLPGTQLAKQPTTWKITLDEAGNAFTPGTIQQVVPGAKFQNVQRLLDYTNLGTYQFPSRIAWTSSSYPPTSPPAITMTGMVTVVSARIPNEVADSLFKLEAEEKAAKRVWDWDQHKFTKSAPHPADSN